jgi:hypothetical protein
MKPHQQLFINRNTTINVKHVMRLPQTQSKNHSTQNNHICEPDMPFNLVKIVENFIQKRALFDPCDKNPPKRDFIALIFESLSHNYDLIDKDSGSVGYTKPDMCCNTFIT